jgi:predicted DCC family thiol-disulfide oxidoreductase YuxK
MTILYDGYCTLCRYSRLVVERLDWFRRLTWIPFQRPDADRFGVPRHVLDQTMCAASGDKRWFGFAAWKKVLLRLPVLYLLVAGSAWITPWMLLAWAVFFAPFAEPAGERVYQWVARNRHRIPGSTCRLDP